MLRSARRPGKACDGISPSSADSLEGCILGNLIKELLEVSRCATCLDDVVKSQKPGIKQYSLSSNTDGSWQRKVAWRKGEMWR